MAKAIEAVFDGMDSKQGIFRKGRKESKLGREIVSIGKEKDLGPDSPRAFRGMVTSHSKQRVVRTIGRQNRFNSAHKITLHAMRKTLKITAHPR